MTGNDHTEVRLERAAAPADGVEVLELAGELDLAHSTRLRELVDEVIAAQPRRLVIDLEQVGFLDSTMLRELLRAHRESEASGGRLVIAGPQPSVRRLLDLTGTAEVFALADSRDAALTS